MNVRMTGKSTINEPHAAASVVQAIATGASSDVSRNRLRDLAESVSRGSALSVDALASGLSHMGRRAKWANVYALSERDIRRAMSGSISSIEESMPKSRFRVLASKFAPADSGRYFSDLKVSSEDIASRYEGLAEMASAILGAARSSASGYLRHEDSLLLSSVHGFIESLSDSAASLSTEFRAIIGEASAEELSVLARTHDLMAEGLLDFTIALSFAEKTMPQPTGVSP